MERLYHEDKHYLIWGGCWSVIESLISLVGTSGFAVLKAHWKVVLLDEASYEIL